MPLIPAGPYRTLKTVEGDPFPYYIVPFDAEGRCEGPLTQQHLFDHVPDYSDIFVFSHGWNNDWSTATERYESFISGFQAQRQSLGLPMPPGYRPLLVGVFWPSQALEWFESETGPGFAAGDPAARNAAVDAARKLLDDIARTLKPEQRTRFFELAQAETLDAAGAGELAAMLSSLVAPDDEGLGAQAPSAKDLLAAAGSLAAPEPDYDAVGTVIGAVPPAQDPQAAFGLGGLFKALDPRQILKPFTVWQMKDRAGKVGAVGVAALLEGILKRSGAARVHLLGHSYGCKVVMTALARLPEGTGQVHSVLLLQPAVSQYAFATKIPERPGMAGGFRAALQRARVPIVATFSANDSALTKMFHLALRRESDLGEPQIAGEPSKYAALGGFGPRDSGETIFEIQDPQQPYQLGAGGRIIGIRGTRTISSHGDISNPSTWWLAYSLATAKG